MDTIAARGLSRGEFATFLDAHVVDLYDDPVETLAALLAYCDATVGAVLRWSAAMPWRAFWRAREAGRALADAGTALGLTRILRRLPLGGGRFVPLELLDRHGVSPDDARAGVDSGPLRSALGELRALALGRFEAARARAGEAGRRDAHRIAARRDRSPLPGAYVAAGL